MLPHFRRSERRAGGNPLFRGTDGPLPVSDIDWQHPLCDAFIAGAESLGIPRNPDYNAASQAGIGFFQRTIDRGWRMSTARAFLKPARRRGNLVIRTQAMATKIIIENKWAVGVDYVRAKRMAEVQTVRARREVIVCAGAINTPKLLQLSGLGAAGFLQEKGIPVAHHLPGVGKNLSDHFSVRLVARARKVRTMNEIASWFSLVGQVIRWLIGVPSVLALSPSLVYFF